MVDGDNAPDKVVEGGGGCNFLCRVEVGAWARVTLCVIAGLGRMRTGGMKQEWRSMKTERGEVMSCGGDGCSFGGGQSACLGSGAFFYDKESSSWEKRRRLGQQTCRKRALLLELAIFRAEQHNALSATHQQRATPADATPRPPSAAIFQIAIPAASKHAKP